MHNFVFRSVKHWEDSDCNTKAESLICFFPVNNKALLKGQGRKMKEEWKSVKGYEGKYEVSNLGRIKSVDHEVKVKQQNREYIVVRKGRMLTPLKRQHGYLGIQLFGKGANARKMKTYSIHRLVAEAFLENLNNLPEINHKDEDKTNNCVENLEWCSRIDNVHHGTAIERRVAKQTNGKKSKKIAQYSMNMELLKVFPSLAEVKRQLGFAPANISKCANGNKSYSHAYGYKWKYVTEL